MYLLEPGGYKIWNMFIHLVEQKNITPAEALTMVLKGKKKNWNEYKIIKDSDQREAITDLLLWEDKISRKRLYDSKVDESIWRLKKK